MFTILLTGIIMTLERPKSITITLSDRKSRKYISFVVYDMKLNDIERKVKKVLEK